MSDICIEENEKNYLNFLVSDALCVLCSGGRGLWSGSKLVNGTLSGGSRIERKLPRLSSGEGKSERKLPRLSTFVKTLVAGEGE